MQREEAIIIIGALVRGMLARKKVALKLRNIPHILEVEVKGADNLNNSNHYIALSAIPDAYVLVNVLREETKKLRTTSFECLSACRTSTSLQSYNPRWSEGVRLTNMGPGYIVFNVFSQGLLSGDNFLGQAGIDLCKFPEIYKQKTADVVLPLSSSLAYPVYSSDGTKVIVSTGSVEGRGSISVSIRVPSIYRNMVSSTDN